MGISIIKIRRLLTHWGWVMHVCISKLTIIISDNCLSPSQRQAIIWTNTEILLIQTLGANFSEILSKIHTFSLKKMHFKMSSGKCRPFCLGLNVLRQCGYIETAPWWNHLSAIPDPKNLKFKIKVPILTSAICSKSSGGILRISPISFRF